MRNAFQTRILAVALALATLCVCVLAAFNLSQELSIDFPTDGIWWVEAQGGLRAERVPADSPGSRAGIRAGDILRTVDDRPMPRVASLERAQVRIGIFSRAAYVLLRPAPGSNDLATAPRLDIPVILEPADRSNAQGSRLIALVYLVIGLYVLFRRWTAPKSTHFYIFCLVSFVLYSFRATGEPGLFDQFIYWGNLLATALQPALFLHFAVSVTTTLDDPTPETPGAPFMTPSSHVMGGVTQVPGAPFMTPSSHVMGGVTQAPGAPFTTPSSHVMGGVTQAPGGPFIAPLSHAMSGEPQNSRLSLKHLLPTLLYLPGAALVFLQLYATHHWSATELLVHRLDQLGVGYLALYYVIAAIVFRARYARENSPLERQQLKWLTRGTLLAVIPFTLLYAIPYLSDATVPNAFAKIALASLVLLPLTFSWAIVRYRLMDVDLIFKRGVTYTLATASLVGAYFGVVALIAETVHTRFAILGPWGLLAAIVITGLVFDPLKRAIQGRVDRVFDQKSFDYRETLVDFGRSLSSQTDLRALLDSVVERLPQTLLVTRVAVFLAPEPDSTTASPKTPTRAFELSNFALSASHGLTNLQTPDLNSLDLSFLNFHRTSANTHIFLENPQQALRLPDSQRRAAARLDLNYYLPCRVANREGVGTRTVAVIGLGRTDSGDFLSSEDMEVLETLAGYIGIAIQNAQLYRSLELKIAEFERLKEFHENIVESIHIGIFAVDLEDRIESWNAQMEVMYALPRADALRQPLSAIFPADFMSRFNTLREDKHSQGTHTLYKLRLALPTGETRTANIAIAPLMTRNFEVVGRIILVDDITERIALEAQLTQSEKLSSIGLLAAGVAHEVNTPLAVISSYTQMLAKYMRPASPQPGTAADPNAPTPDPRLAPILEKITQQTFRASEIVNGLLNFSRTSGVEFTSVDLNQLLADTLTLVSHQFKTASIRIERDLATGLPRIHGNEGKLQQVLLNLLLNARDAMHGTPGAVLRIATAHTGTRVTLTVQDSGSGIDPEHLHRIYDPFFTTKTKPRPGEHKGTGLGLAVSYGIMQEHAGKMLVESTPGTGTTFTLEFPIETDTRVPHVRQASPSDVGLLTT